MTSSNTKGINLSKLQEYNTSRILSNVTSPLPIDTSLSKNPFLKDQEKYHYLMYKITDYNKRLQLSQVTDHYESLYYNKLNSVLMSLSFLGSKDDQLVTLDEIYGWVKKQEDLIEQRKDQGNVRYEVNKELRLGINIEVERENKEKEGSVVEELEEIPSETVARLLLPFQKKWRTVHKELDIPARRLNEYKRKILNITPFIEAKEEKKIPSITYPKVPKVQYHKEEENEEGKNEEESPNPLIPSSIPENMNTEEKAENQEIEQDLGGPADEQDPEDEEPVEEGDDKLAPKLKSFAYDYQDIKGKAGYIFYRGKDNSVEKRMEEKYLLLQHEQIKKQKEDRLAVGVLEQWAVAKSKMDKEHNKRLENKIFNPKYSFSFEEPEKREMLNTADELKFGLTENLRKPSNANEILLYQSNLPKIGQENLFEKSIRKDRLKSLKNKFGKLLNLQEREEREFSSSLCQYSSRKRGLSEVIRNHSKSKERLNQLEEVTRIKEKLAGNKIGVDIRSLSMGLCVPEEVSNDFAPLIPGNLLPSNPFMVETKKKKKKKK